MKTFLWGYFGGLNVGDELILRAELELLGPENVIVVARGNPFYVADLHGVEVISYKQALPLVPLGKHIVGGGGLFQDTTSIHNLFYYVYPMVFSRQAILLGVGIGPLHHHLSRRIVASALHSCRMISVRDSVSYRFVSFYAGMDRVILAPDMVFTLNIVSHEDVKDDELILIPGPALGNHWEKVLYLTSQYKVTVVDFLPHIDKKWRKEYPTHWKIVNGIEALKTGELWHILARGYRWIAGRLHGMILACLMNKPFYPIVYDVKMTLLTSDYCPVSYDDIGYANIDITEAQRVRSEAQKAYRKIRKYLVGKGWVE
jgi:polysaccharide pyruvyl transferase CsaB